MPRISPDLLRIAGLAAVGSVTLLIAVVGWYWLPSRSIALERQSQALVRQIERAQHDLGVNHTNTADADAADRTGILARLPDTRTIVGRTREILDALSGFDVRDLEYDAAPREAKAGLVFQNVTVRFRTDAVTAARVFSRLAEFSPTTTLIDASLEKAGGDALNVQLHVRLAWRA